MKSFAAALALMNSWIIPSAPSEPNYPASRGMRRYRERSTRRDTTFTRHLTVNADKNRTARRSTAKIRHSAPRAFGGNQQARMTAWAIKNSLLSA